MSNEELSFARLVPVNRRARQLFSAAVLQAQAKQNEFQLRFYADEELHLHVRPETVQTETVQTSKPQLDPESAFASLSIHPVKLPKNPRIGWRVGRDAEDVDIFIADPSEKAGSPTYFRLFLHPRSGVLVLETSPAHSDGFVAYRDRGHRVTPLRPQQRLVLTNRITSIVVVGCELQIIYTLDPAEALRFSIQRERLISRLHGFQLHNLALTCPNVEDSVLVGRYLCGKVIGVGGFGDVRYAIDTSTGEPAAIKDVRVQPESRRSICKEIALQEAMKNSPHVLGILDAWCENHDRHPKNCPATRPEHFYIATEIAHCDFRSNIFRQEIPDTDALECFHQTLLGIQDIRKQGMMHRDISGGNMLVISLKPLRAVIGDFGKAVHATSHHETHIGPIPTLAPEVWSKKYTAAIDLWAWAYAAAEHLGYRPSPGERNTRINLHRLGKIWAFLDEASQTSVHTKRAQFIDLLRSILVWNVDSRIGIDEAVAHEVWTDARATAQADVLEPEEAAGSPQSKRQRLEESVPSSKDQSAGSVSTAPFSEA